MVSGAQYNAILANKMSEKALDREVRGLLNDLGLAETSFHPPDGVGRMRAGYPDWTIVGRRVLFRELKTMKGKPTKAQEKFLKALADAGQDVDIWRPIDLYSGRIARELAEVALVAVSRRRRAA